ncbi:MAG: isopentenyl phosphate kinase [Phototrophicaceae bacterium]
MITLIKLGGSLITDKTSERSFNAHIVHQIASVIHQTKQHTPSLKIIIGHGSGSFGHFEAKRHNTIQGVHTSQQWEGFTAVAHAARELNYMVSKEMRQAGLPIWSLQPSASAITDDMKIEIMQLETLQVALDNGVIPLVYGDVAIDRKLGGTIISTETIFQYLTEQFPVERILLLGTTDGVYDQNGEVIEHITPQNYSQYADVLGGSDGVDVTGGMLTKVNDMLSLVDSFDGLTIRIMNGTHYESLYQVLMNNTQQIGTLISV